MLISETLEIMRSSYVNILGFKACEIAYNNCEKWLEELIQVLDRNQKIVKEFFEKRFPHKLGISCRGNISFMVRFQGLWDYQIKNFRKIYAYGSSNSFTDEGYIFGAEGSGYERVNLAAPTWVIEKALERLGNALEKIYKTKK